jgi:hypothetical protein
VFVVISPLNNFVVSISFLVMLYYVYDSTYCKLNIKFRSTLVQVNTLDQLHKKTAVRLPVATSATVNYYDFVPGCRRAISVGTTRSDICAMDLDILNCEISTTNKFCSNKRLSTAICNSRCSVQVSAFQHL